MSKFFAIFIPVFSIIITTLLVTFLKNNPSKVNKRKLIILVIIGVAVFIISFGVIFFGK